MAKSKKPSPRDVVLYGRPIATAKANMPRKRWKFILKQSQQRGVTVAGLLGGGPKALQERRPDALRKQAQQTMAAAYKPVRAELSRRELATRYLEEKRTADDAAYRTWLTGEVDKLDAQARAADTTLMTQQANIAEGLKTAQTAAQADSLQRMAQTAGNVSDTSQSTALNYSAADARSREHVANQRTLSADMRKIGGDAATMSRAAMIATAAVREATRRTEIDKQRNEISTERLKVAGQQSADAAELLEDLRSQEISKAQANREFGMAANELGFKQAELAMDVKEANRKFRLENKKFNLSKWVARNERLADRAKLQLEYDKIVENQGQKAADRALRQWVERYKAKKSQERQDDSQAADRAKDKREGKGGVSDEARKLYREVMTVRGLIVREHSRGTPADKIRQRIRKQGFDDVMIDLAEDLRLSGGMLTNRGASLARRLGIGRPGYFWDRQGSAGANAHPRT